MHLAFWNSKAKMQKRRLRTSLEPMPWQIPFVKQFAKWKVLTMKPEIIFPLMMVIGAAGSLVTNIISRGEWATSLQWAGAMLLYFALTFRNVG